MGAAFEVAPIVTRDSALQLLLIYAHTSFRRTLMRCLRSGLAMILVVLGCSHEAESTRTLPTATATDRFWALIETARAKGEQCERLAGRLTDALAALPPSAIVEFDNEFTTRMAESYRWDLWAVAYVAKGGASDDAFDYFRGWLLTRGRKRFEQALADPAAATEGTSRFAFRFAFLECEAILSVPNDAYQRATGSELPRSTVAFPSAPTGKPWTEENLDQVYPGLAARVQRR